MTLVVGLGASAGGIKVIQQILARVPDHSGAAFVIIMHLSPDYDSHLGEILQPSTRLPITTVYGSVTIEPNHIYCIAANSVLQLGGEGNLVASAMQDPTERYKPIDLFFTSLAERCGARAVGVILSGMGEDGSVGLQRISKLGGLVIAQVPEDADSEDMPRNAILTGMVDDVLRADAIPQRIMDYREQAGLLTAQALAGDEIAGLEILTLLRTYTQHDFTGYKHSTLLRRVERRMIALDSKDLDDYVRCLRETPGEARVLMNDLLIGITNFFRDPEAFAALEQTVIPQLLADKGADDQVRIWVAGCATGEEAYSVAILLAEHSARMADPPDVQVFATDLDAEAISHARAGLYAESITAHLSGERLRRFFIQEPQGYRVKPKLRDSIIFAVHNLLRDPPFSSLDLVSCRNVLIYLNSSAQDRVLRSFHYALRPQGVLFLGIAEAPNDLFVPSDAQHHLYSARQVTRRSASSFSLPLDVQHLREVGQRSEVSAPPPSVLGELHLKTLEEYAPPSLIVDLDYRILHVSERVGQYLHFASGEFSADLLATVLPDLRPALHALLLEAGEEGRAEMSDVPVHIRGEARLLRLIVRPAALREGAQRGYLLVIFEEHGPRAEAGSPSQELAQRALPLHDEERSRLRLQLHQTVERYERSNQALRAVNETLQSINEELRSATEEMETSKEELQSINEEMRTVNQELKHKVEELDRTNNNLRNLMAATDTASIFLDRELRVKLFTARALDVFNLILDDIGRPLAHLTHGLDYPDLFTDAQQVLDTLQVVEREVRGPDQRWYIARLLPYRTSEDRIDGVVLTLTDLTRIKRAEEERERLHLIVQVEREHLRQVIEQMPSGVLLAEVPSGQVMYYNRRCADFFGEQLPASIADSLTWPFVSRTGQNQEVPDSPDKSPMAQALRGETVTDAEVHLPGPGGVQWVVSVSASPITDGAGRTVTTVMSFHDITERQQLMETIQNAALHDRLTGLANRALMMEHLQRLIARAKRHPEAQYAVLFLDLDRFKVINDSLGHVLADQLLVQIARKLELCVRPGDVIARFGGDEFTILLGDVQGAAEVIGVTDRVLNALETPYQLDHHEVFTTVSIGIRLGSSDDKLPEDVLRDADTAMYHAKAAGRGSYAVFDPQMHAKAMRRWQLEMDLRRGLERQEFRVFYQPLVTVADRRIVGFEALIRWQHPERGLVLPGEFIPEAEETGLIVPIGRWVLDEVGRQLHVWRTQDGVDLDLTVSINLSSKQFGQAGLAEQIEAVIKTNGIEARHLKLELTENLIMEQPAGAEVLAQLQALGYELYIDDFGTGYSSLGYIQKLGVSALKIDRSFIEGMENTSQSLEIVRTIITLAHSLGLQVVAEGVETEGQYLRLQGLGCDLVQGYYLSPPVRADEAQALLE